MLKWIGPETPIQASRSVLDGVTGNTLGSGPRECRFEACSSSTVDVGKWLSRLIWDQEFGSSNLSIRTLQEPRPG